MNESKSKWVAVKMENVHIGDKLMGGFYVRRSYMVGTDVHLHIAEQGAEHDTSTFVGRAGVHSVFVQQ